MEALNKNKEEIEKILKEIKDIEESKSLRDSCKDYFYKKFGDNWEKEFYKKHLEQIKSHCDYLNLKLRAKATIKTSILWCKDEIERIKKLRLTLMYVKDKHKEGLKKVWDKEKEQLQTHLTWLKEQKKKQ